MNSSTPALEGPASRVRLTVAYDGRGFHGFAVNAGVRTVAGELVAALIAGLYLWFQVVRRFFPAPPQPDLP